MDAKETRAFIAKRVAKEFKDGDVANLGIGLPTEVANYLPKDIHITFQSENGILGVGPAPEPGKEDPDYVNAGRRPITVMPGACFFDSGMSFSIIRGGHVDITVLGALQVDGYGDLANWKIPGKLLPGVGGAMDLVTGAKRVIVAMTHTQKGTPKILKNCSLPLTAKGQVNDIITEMGVMKITDKGIVLAEVAPGYTVEDVQAATDAELIIPDDLKVMAVD
jgi:acetate CoA/acetoacetate CoA-transferase beta subunit